MNWKALLTIFIFLAGILMASIGDAEAARFGGGRSFGSRPSMQRSMPAPLTRQTPPVAGAAAGATAQKSGLLGGMGGMFGGLLAGTLLGSLLFGGGFNGGGLLDILIIGVLLFVAYKLFTRFRANRPVPAGGPDPGPAYAPREEPAGMQRQDTGTNWSPLQKRPDPGAVPVAPEITVPAGFDAEEFLRGAKLAFTRLQASWDKRDLEDIAQFTSPAVLQEVRNQFETDPTPGRTELLLVNARLLNVKEDNGEQTASVFFDVLLREAPSTDTTQVREVWHFVRPLNGNESWKLDGIQQVE